MKKKAVSEIMLILFLIGILSLALSFSASLASLTTRVRLLKMCDDAMIPPDVAGGLVTLQSSPAPSYYETSEFLIGSVAVGVILVESNGDIDPETENWTSTEESQVIIEIQNGTNWLANQNSDAGVSLTYDIHYGVPVGYEPINRPHTDEDLWIDEAMEYLGYPGSDIWTQTRDYINDLRDSKGTDWAFVIFVVDSSNDNDDYPGCFTDWKDPGDHSKGKWFAYAYLGGPFFVMTYDNNGWGISEMDRVAAHETCHIFYATDEYNGETEYSGYLNHWDIEGSGCLMDDEMAWVLSGGTVRQIGWRDSDGDDLQDIVDTFPDTVLNPYSPDPTNEPTLTYTGAVTDVPYPNNNPHGTGRNITINTITNVEFRVDGGTWHSATADDGAFDGAEETFSFTTSSLEMGTHTIETRGINSAGNVETSYASDTVTRLPVIHRVPEDYLSIQEAIDASYDEDIVQVASGVYYENIIINNKKLSLIGENASTTIIDGYTGEPEPEGTVCEFSYASVNMSGFTIRNGECGLRILYASNSTLRNITLCDNYFNIMILAGDPVEFGQPSLNYLVSLDIDTSNTVNGKPIYYVVNQKDAVIPSDAGYVALVNSTGGTISHANLTNNFEGLLLVYTNSCIIEDTEVSFNYLGITLINSYNNTILRNRVAMNDRGIESYNSANNRFLNNEALGNGLGLALWGSNNVVAGNNASYNAVGIIIEDGNTILNNTCSYNDLEAIYVQGIENTIVGNAIEKNQYGINLYLLYLANNTMNNNRICGNAIGIRIRGSGYWPTVGNNIVGNLISENEIGIYLENTADNFIHHNSFTNNTNHLYTSNSVNVWDDDYPSGGNYWSDYNGTDLYGGSHQNVTGSDGIGDKSYVIDGQNQDNYPLMKPWAPPDIAVNNATSSKTIVGQGFTLNIDVTLSNQGNKVEGCDVQVYANTTSIVLLDIILMSGDSTTLTFTWNTTGVAKGNYTITAKAAQLPYETNTTDNIYIDGWVVVTILGDVNGDFEVDVFDKVIVGAAFGATYNTTDGMYWHQPPDFVEPCIYCPHNPNADINGDLTIDIFDKVVVGYHFGETDH